VFAVSSNSSFVVILSLIIAGTAAFFAGLPQILSWRKRAKTRDVTEVRKDDLLWGHPADPENNIPQQPGIVQRVFHLEQDVKGHERRIKILERIFGNRGQR
jgi:hypothetical protein